MGHPALIFKVIPAAEWKAAQQASVYHGSAHDKQDGFLHFSTAAQLEETLRRHYANAGAIVIAAVNAAALGDILKFEYSSSRGENFPHLYGPLKLVYEPPEKATVLSELFTHYPPFIEQQGISDWLKYLETQSS